MQAGELWWRTRQARESTGLPEQRPSSLRPRDVLTLWVFKRCSQPKYLCEISTHCQSNESRPRATIFKSVSIVMFTTSVCQYQRVASNVDETLAKTRLWGHFLLPHKYWAPVHIYYHTMKMAFSPHKGSLYTKTVGLCCQFCSVVPFVLESINRHKNQMLCFTPHFL